MNNCAIDFSPLFRSSIGYDHVSRLMETALASPKSAPNYPPYNIEKYGENNYRITMAVAGFSDDDLQLTQKDNLLIVTGQKTKDAKENCTENEACSPGVIFLHRGIGQRNFETHFQLADHVRVENAKLQSGLLHIELKREVPEEKKPRTIKVEMARA
ncbi:MAG TPA: hypothetical protein DIS76_06980 [Rhodospirillaceae bacterium]|nr:hypothetical protein [Rhodospirillaceae bacterium]